MTFLGFSSIYDSEFMSLLHFIFRLIGMVRLHLTLRIKEPRSNPSDVLGRESERNVATRLRVTVRSN